MSFPVIIVEKQGKAPILWTLCLLTFFTYVHLQAGEEQDTANWLPAKAYVVPKHTAPDGEGYFSIIEGLNRKLYIGTHANGINSWLVEFDPAAETMKVVVDAHKAIGKDLKGFASQAKIHTRNNVGRSGKIYFATKQGYPAKDEKQTDYPGGYPMVYDPATQQTKVYPIPIAHQGIISVTPDESRHLAYISTCSDGRPIESTHFMVLDLKTGKYRDLMDCEHSYAFIVVDHKGNAYHPIRGGTVARYNPDSGKLDILEQTIDGHKPAADSHLADKNSHPINWDISPDRRTLYAVPMSGNALYSYDLTNTQNQLPGHFLGPLINGAVKTDCRGMCVGPSGTVWAIVSKRIKGIQEPHLVRYRPGKDKEPADLGIVYVTNPGFSKFVDENGKPLPAHNGFAVLANGKMISKVVTLGICEARNGNLYILALRPYSVLKVDGRVLEKAN